MIPTGARYTLSTYDEDVPGEHWRVRRRHLTPRGLIKEIAKWEGLGYDREVTILVERENRATAQEPMPLFGGGM